MSAQRSKNLISFFVTLISFILLVSTPLFAAGKEIKIGVIYPLSGSLATIGRVQQRAAELMAEDVINNKNSGVDIPIAKWGGIPSLGHAKIKLIFADHRGEPDRGADLAKRLILDDKVVGLMGCYNSSVTKTASAVAERYGIPMINDCSTSPDLTRRGLKWFWRTTPHEEQFNKELFEGFLKALTEGKIKGVNAVPKDQIKNIAYACENTEWGSSVAKDLERFAKEFGFNVLKGLLYNANTSDLSS
jgi:branched-chain amino acid transport system substrate-binding protein